MKIEEGPESTFFIRRHTNVQQVYNNVFKIIIPRKMQIKTTMRYCLIPIRMEIITQKKMMNIGSDVEKRQPLYSVSEDINWYSHYGKKS